MAKGTKKDVSNNREEINIKEFMLLSAPAQSEKVRETLNKMYEGNVEVTNKHIEKVLNIAFEPKDTEIYLPDNLRVTKDGDKLIFIFKKKNNGLLFLLFLLGFLFIGGFATYTGVQLLNKKDLNVDIDGDGIPDINIDLDDDGTCDINCDNDGDKKPDRNIDFHGNRRPIFNIIIINEAGNEEIKNPTNQDVDGDGVCDINCDTNNDGWPDLNIDIDGDGIVDTDRDIDGDGVKDLDIDNNGDGICDMNCDDDPKDNICDHLCSNVPIEDNGGGTSSQTGNNQISADTAALVVIFDDTNAIAVDMIYPDDQKGEEGITTEIPDMTWTITNTTDRTLYYDIDWQEVYNNYESDNFRFKITATGGGYNHGWLPVPTGDGHLATKIAIPARSSQSYAISWTLHGTGEEQNYDQGKSFKGKIYINLLNNN